MRHRTEEWEEEYLSPQAALSSRSRGRIRPEEPCQVRSDFQRDRDRIIHCKAFRRLKHKTQVFIAPEGDHFRTRLTHTLEVAQISRTVARALRLNEDLTEAIALGHDLGHTPFGHAGEEALDQIHPGGFHHNAQSLRVVDKLEGDRGLNLTEEVRDGILHHTGPYQPFTLEGQIVKICDRIAYINHDIDDCLRGGVLREEDLPRHLIAPLGSRHGDRINTLVLDLIYSSMGQPEIRQSPEIGQEMEELRQFLFGYVYIGSSAKTEEAKAKRLLRELYLYYVENGDEIPQCPGNWDDQVERRALDHIAGMTDRYATAQYLQLFVPQGFRT